LKHRPYFDSQPHSLFASIPTNFPIGTSISFVKGETSTQWGSFYFNVLGLRFVWYDDDVLEIKWLFLVRLPKLIFVSSANRSQLVSEVIPLGILTSSSWVHFAFCNTRESIPCWCFLKTKAIADSLTTRTRSHVRIQNINY